MTRRQAPSVAAIARWWDINYRPGGHRPFSFGYIGAGEPFCFRCGWLPPVDDCDPDTDRSVWDAWRRAAPWLERAHLEDFCSREAAGVPEDVANYVLLCSPCHRDQMPEFQHGQWAEALAWVESGEHCSGWYQIATDCLGQCNAKPRGMTLHRLAKDMLLDAYAAAAAAAAGASDAAESVDW